MAITIATIRNAIYTALYNYLQNGTYAITSNNIYPNFNHEQIIKDGYPSVIINKPHVPFKRLTVANLGRWKCDFSVDIEVWHNSSENAKTVADQVTEKILSGILVLRSSGLSMIQFGDDSTNTIPYTQEKTLHTYTIKLSGNYIGMSI